MVGLYFSKGLPHIKGTNGSSIIFICSRPITLVRRKTRTNHWLGRGTGTNNIRDHAYQRDGRTELISIRQGRGLAPAWIMAT